MKDLVDHDVLGKAVAGCPAAFAAVVEVYYDAIYRMAWRWVGQRDDAEDVAQDVCVKLARAIRSFRGEAEFSTWLYRLTYHAALDHLRARKRSQRTEDPAVVVLFQGGMQDSAERARESDLWDEVGKLPPQQRDAVLLVYAEGLSHAEAAEIMGCTEKTVSWHLHAARKRLKTQLQAVG